MPDSSFDDGDKSGSAGKVLDAKANEERSKERVRSDLATDCDGFFKPFCFEDGHFNHPDDAGMRGVVEIAHAGVAPVDAKGVLD